MTTTLPGPCETVRLGQNIFVRAVDVRGPRVTLAAEPRRDGEPVRLRAGRVELDVADVTGPPRVKRPA